MDTISRTVLVAGGDVWTGGDAPVLMRGHDILIVDGHVATIEPNYRGHADRVVDAEGAIVIPGLINAHVHSGCSPHIRSISEDLEIPKDGAFYHGLNTLLGVGFANLDIDEYAALIEWDVAAMLLGGATTIVEENFGGHDRWIEICGRLGFRGQIGRTYPGSVGSIGYLRDGQIVLDSGGDIPSQFAAALQLVDSHDGMFGGRLGVHLSPHGPDTVPEDILRETARVSAERGLGVHLHLAQHLNERKTIAERTGGKTSIEYLHDIGFLSERVMAMHVTFMGDGDAARLASTGTTVVHGAYRKAKEALTSPYWDVAKQGVNVAIATDSFAHDLIQDLRFAAMLGKIRGGSSSEPTAAQVLWSATGGAARALGRKDLGHLNPGARGDLVVVDLTSPFAAPVYDPVKALVYYTSCRDIRTTLVEGQPVVENGRVVNADLDDLRRRAKLAAERVWALGEKQGVIEPRQALETHACGPNCSH